MHLALGTAQLGMPYGATNRLGRSPTAKESRELLETAWSLGIARFDTAQAYGESELRVGDFFASLPSDEKHRAVVSTKIMLSGAESVSEVLRVIEISSERLGLSEIPIVLLHRSDAWSMEFLEGLPEIKRSGLVRKLGVSLYDLDEFSRVISSSPMPDVIQAPVNALDWRFSRKDLLRDMFAKDAIPEIWGRSVFLQGLLLADDVSVWNVTGQMDGILNGVPRALSALRDGTHKTALEFSLSVLREACDLDVLVTGAETSWQVREIANIWKKTADMPQDQILPFAGCAMLASIVAGSLVDPRSWPAR